MNQLFDSTRKSTIIFSQNSKESFVYLDLVRAEVSVGKEDRDTFTRTLTAHQKNPFSGSEDVVLNNYHYREHF